MIGSSNIRIDKLKLFLQRFDASAILKDLYLIWFASEGGPQSRPVLNNKNPFGEVTISKFRVTAEYIPVLGDLDIQPLMINKPLRASRISGQIRAELILSLISFSLVLFEAEILSGEPAALLSKLRGIGGF